MKIRLIACLLCTLLLASCSFKDNNAESMEAVAIATEQNNLSDDIWNEYIARNGETVEGLLGIPQAPDLRPLYLDGLSNKSPLVRWYSANRIIEFADNSDIQLIKALEGLQNDQEPKVKAAAQFALSAIKKSFEGDWFVKSQDGKKVAFYRFHEAMYNDGDIWISIDESSGSWYKFNVEGSIRRMTWSPNGSRLCVEYGGRSWVFVAYIDLELYQVKDVRLFSHIMQKVKDLGYKEVTNPRSDPSITLLEWSPEGDRLLLFYSYTDDDLKIQSGTAIYDINRNSFERITPNAEEADEGVEPQKPENFNWND